MIASIRHWWASIRLLCCELAIALYEQAPPLSPAFAQVPELKEQEAGTWPTFAPSRMNRNERSLVDAFRFTMHMAIKKIAARHWQELSRKIHFDARSNGQRRRHEREQRERKE